jgi:hypothetical protein
VLHDEGRWKAPPGNPMARQYVRLVNAHSVSIGVTPRTVLRLVRRRLLIIPIFGHAMTARLARLLAPRIYVVLGVL